MQIYPIAESLERLMESFIDPDTGELTATEEEMQAAIEQMQMDFDEKIIELRNEYINLTAEAETPRSLKQRPSRTKEQSLKSGRKERKMPRTV